MGGFAALVVGGLLAAQYCCAVSVRAFNPQACIGPDSSGHHPPRRIRVLKKTVWPLPEEIAVLDARAVICNEPGFQVIYSLNNEEDSWHAGRMAGTVDLVPIPYKHHKIAKYLRQKGRLMNMIAWEDDLP